MSRVPIWRAALIISVALTAAAFLYQSSLLMDNDLKQAKRVMYWVMAGGIAVWISWGSLSSARAQDRKDRLALAESMAQLSIIEKTKSAWINSLKIEAELFGASHHFNRGAFYSLYGQKRTEGYLYLGGDPLDASSWSDLH